MQADVSRKQDCKKYFHHSQPTIDQDDQQSIIKVLNSKNIAQGKLKLEFEKKFTNYIGGIETSLTNTGRSALFIALETIRAKENDEIIVPTYVCSSVLETIEQIGAKVKVVDIGENYCIDRNTILNSITEKTKAVVIVHTFGISAEIEPIKKLLKEKNVYLIEDCAHAVGGTNNGRRLGSFGDISFFSFQATKMLTSGEGGAVVLNNKRLISNFYDVKNKYKKLFAISDINTSLLMAQFEKLDLFIYQRRELAKKYIYELKTSKKIQIPIDNIDRSVFFRFILKIKDMDFEKIKRCMDKKNVAVRRGVDSMLHSELDKNHYKNAEKTYQETLSLPIYPSLSFEDVEYIAKSLKECLDE